MPHGPTLKLILVLVIVGLALATGLPPLLRRAHGRTPGAVAWGEALAAGVFLGAGLIHMLGDADSDFAEAGVDYPWSMVICGAVLLALLWVEHFGNRLSEARGVNANTLPVMGAAVLSVHSFLAGAAFGSSSTAAVTLVIFFAVLAHKGAAAFALAQELSQSTLGTATTLLLFTLFVGMFPAGALVGQLVGAETAAHPLVEPVFASLAAGTFLYLATLHGLRDNVLIADAKKAPEFTLTVLGFALMAIVAIWT